MGKDLQAAQRRIQEFEQMAPQSKENAVQMQNLESRLKACEQQISKPEHLIEGMTRTTRDRNGASLLSEQDGVPELAQSVNELDVGNGRWNPFEAGGPVNRRGSAQVVEGGAGRSMASRMHA
ncbi:hypothetical protein N7476_000303 [Penicillium atrosanguineum]|uniref:Uncharacterized protein n=1 Tax=Penicillium atrosanguineum TaxID=1132637 RepID=A0A9W9QBT1_9EURO|nr:hypothetical protein N7476_000303 [Penicillium atrosanguineum]